MDRDALLKTPSHAPLGPLQSTPSRLPGEQGFPWTGLTLCVVIVSLLAFLAIPRPRPHTRESAPPSLHPAENPAPAPKASPIR